MKLDIYRRKLWPEGWTGELCIDGTLNCYTVEPHPTNPVHPGHPCIPAGVVHKIALTKSPHFGYVTPEVLNVAGRTAIRIHRANWPRELLGCTGVGTSVSVSQCAVNSSKIAFEKLMVILEACHGEIDAEWHDSQPDVL